MKKERRWAFIGMVLAVSLALIVLTSFMVDNSKRIKTIENKQYFKDFIVGADAKKHIHDDRPYNDDIARIEKRLDQLECEHFGFFYEAYREYGYTYFSKRCCYCDKIFEISADEYWQALKEQVENKSLFLWKDEK